MGHDIGLISFDSESPRGLLSLVEFVIDAPKFTQLGLSENLNPFKSRISPSLQSRQIKVFLFAKSQLKVFLGISSFSFIPSKSTPSEYPVTEGLALMSHLF